MKSSIFALPALAASLAAATTTSITVGPGLVFTPDSVQAASGDVLEFHFTNDEHNVVEGAFDKPCQPSGDNAVYSGMPSGGSVFSVTVNSTDPLYFYCAVTGHCQGGMVMAVNPPSSGNTLDAYKSAAAGSSGSSAPANVQGGVFGSSSGSSSSSASGSSSATGSSTMMSGSSSGMTSATGTSSSSSSSGGAAVATGMPLAAGAVAGLAAFFL